VISFHRKKDRLRVHLAQRLKNADIECRDAIKVIKSRDTANSFFFIDPPNTHDFVSKNKPTYTPEDYITLLDTLPKIRGKFLLVASPSDILQAYCKRNDRFSTYPENKNAIQTEIFVANYPI